MKDNPFRQSTIARPAIPPIRQKFKKGIGIPFREGSVELEDAINETEPHIHLTILRVVTYNRKSPIRIVW